jgi:hypothetical protein
MALQRYPQYGSLNKVSHPQISARPGDEVDGYIFWVSARESNMAIITCQTDATEAKVP